MKNTDTKIASITKDLISDSTATDWVSWLFDIQNNLISHNHLEAYTAKGNKEFADKFSELKGFFDNLSKLQINKS